MKRNRKPVRKCHGCGLNLGDHCGVFPNPHDMWHNRSCPGFQNEAMLQEFDAQTKGDVASAERIDRRLAGKRARTEPHHQGFRNPSIRVPGV